MASHPPEIDDSNDADAEFAAEFERLAAERDGTAPRQPAPAEEAKPEGNAPDGDEPAPQAPAKPDEDGTSGSEPKGDGDQPPPKVEASDDDPWKDVPPEVRERIAALEKDKQRVDAVLKAKVEEASARAEQMLKKAQASNGG